MAAVDGSCLGVSDPYTNRVETSGGCLTLEIAGAHAHRVQAAVELCPECIRAWTLPWPLDEAPSGATEPPGCCGKDASARVGVAHAPCSCGHCQVF